jgi:hypothetical protein
MLIALNQIVNNGGTRRVLVKADSINYMACKESGYGAVVYTFIGCICVVETVEQINELVSSKTQGRDADLSTGNK